MNQDKYLLRIDINLIASNIIEANEVAILLLKDIMQKSNQADIVVSNYGVISESEVRKNG